MIAHNRKMSGEASLQQNRRSISDGSSSAAAVQAQPSVKRREFATRLLIKPQNRAESPKALSSEKP